VASLGTRATRRPRAEEAASLGTRANPGSAHAGEPGTAAGPAIHATPSCAVAAAVAGVRRRGRRARRAGPARATTGTSQSVTRKDETSTVTSLRASFYATT